LANYKIHRLGVHESGVWREYTYEHILPWRLRFLNILESIRGEVIDYLRTHPEIKLHRYFHHLNSSQALAFNLFFPYFADNGTSAQLLADGLGLGGDVDNWKFEFIPDKHESTNVDVAWLKSRRRWIFCEVKLSESEFGSAEPDEKHAKKLQQIYYPKLHGLVEEDLLELNKFCRHYQLLRYIYLLATYAGSNIVLLFPKENERLCKDLKDVLEKIGTDLRQRLHTAHLDDVLTNLAGYKSLDPELRLHAVHLQEKYIVTQ
jgi:hypothetical protein